MMDTNFSKDSNSFSSNNYRNIWRRYSKESIARRAAQEEGFLGQEIDYRKFIFAPEGYEGLMISLYLLTLPYLVGLSFLFLFIARSSYEYFLEFNLTAYFAIWAIGYEVSAVLLMGIIILAWINYHRNRHIRELDLKTTNTTKDFETL